MILANLSCGAVGNSGRQEGIGGRDSQVQLLLVLKLKLVLLLWLLWRLRLQLGWDSDGNLGHEGRWCVGLRGRHPSKADGADADALLGEGEHGGKAQGDDDRDIGVDGGPEQDVEDHLRLVADGLAPPLLKEFVVLVEQEVVKLEAQNAGWGDSNDWKTERQKKITVSSDFNEKGRKKKKEK